MTLEELNQRLSEGRLVFPPKDSRFLAGQHACTTHSHQVHPGRINVEVEGLEHLQAYYIGAIDAFTYVPEDQLARTWIVRQMKMNGKRVSVLVPE